MNWLAVAKPEEIASGKPKVVSADNTRIAVFKLDDGYYAIEDLCTHDDGPMAEGSVEGESIECPRHGAKFNLKTGAVECMPAITPVRTFPVRVQGGKVEIGIE